MPAPGDAVTLDGSSGGGTVTVAATFNTGNSLGSLTMGAFAGTLDFSTNNPNITFTAVGGFTGTGIGVRTLNMGSGLWSLPYTATWNVAISTSFTLNKNTSTIEITGSNSGMFSFSGGGLSYHNVTFDANASKGAFTISGSNNFDTLMVSAPNTVYLTNGTTQTVATLTLGATSASSQISVLSTSATAAGTLSIGTISGAGVFDWGAFRQVTFAGTASPVTANDSYDLGNNTSATINPPSGAHIIGG